MYGWARRCEIKRSQSFCIRLAKWKSKFGGMNVSHVTKIRLREDENRRLKRLLADSALEIDALKLITSGNF